MKQKFIISLVLIIAALSTLTYLLSNSPEVAIRYHLFSTNPIQSLTCIITKTDFIDKGYGQQYLIDGLETDSGEDIIYAYINKNSWGLYYWTGGGTGP